VARDVEIRAEKYKFFKGNKKLAEMCNQTWTICDWEKNDF
jgi:hypothetical protein